MTVHYFTRIDAQANMARFYKLDVQRNLFGPWPLVWEWGRNGRLGTVHFEVHGTRVAADIALIAE